MLAAIVMGGVVVAEAATPRRPGKSPPNQPNTPPTPATPATPATQPAPDPDIIARVKLPAPVNATTVGGGGKYLVLHLPKLRQLAVYDVGEGKVTKYLPVPTNDITFSAGAEKLFVGLRDLKQIQRWNLKSLELETTLPAPEGGIGEIAIGATATGPVLLTGDKRFWQLDPKTLKATRFPSKHWGTDGSAWGPVHVQVSFDGSTSAACGGGWGGIEVGSLAGGVVTEAHQGWSILEGDMLVAGNGAFIFANNAIVRRDLSGAVSGIEGIPFPADDAAFSLAFDKRDKPRLTLFSNSDPIPLVTIEVPELREDSKLPIFHRVHLIPSSKRLITLAPGSEELIVRNFDAAARLAASGVDFLFVESAPVCTARRGSEYNYEMKVQSRSGKAAMELQAGPPGMKLSADGKLHWAVPANFTDATVPVIIYVKDSSTAASTFHTFEIRMDGASGTVVGAAVPKGSAKPAPAKPTRAAAAAPTPPRAAEEATQAESSPETATKIVKLDEPFAAFHAAHGGRILVFFEKEAKRLVCYDTASGQELGHVSVAGDDALFTCGRDAIIVALPAQKILQRYDLKTLQRTKSAPIPDTRPLHTIKMGNDSAGPVLLHFGGELVPIDSTTLAKLSIRGGLPAGEANRWFEYRISSNGSTVVSCDTSGSPGIFSVTKIQNRVATTVGSEEWLGMANRQFTPSADGALIMYEMNFFNAKAKRVASGIEGYSNAIPTSDPRFFIAVRGGDKGNAIALCTTNDRHIVAEMEGLSDIGNGDPGEPRVVFLSDSKTIALVPVTNDHFQIRKMSLPGDAVAGAGGGGGKTAPAAAATGPLSVISNPPTEAAINATFSYQIQVLPEKASVKYKVEAGPPGLTVSPTGLVTWKPTERPIGGTVNVILSITDASGQDVPHSFDIAVTRASSANAASSAKPTTASAASAEPPAGDIVKADDRRIELPGDNYRYLPGMSGHALVLAGDKLAILALDGFTIQKHLELPRSYVTLAERKGYYVALCQEPRSIDIIDKTTLKVIRSRTIAFDELIDLALHPTQAISYVSYTQRADFPRHHFLIFDENTTEARTDDNWIGQWLAIAPGGEFLMTGFQETFRQGSDIIDNPDRIWIVPSYGSFDSLARYDLQESTGVPLHVAHRENVGGNGVGIRLSPDGQRVTYLSHTGFPDMSHNIGGWKASDLAKLPVSYPAKDAASTLDLAFHPILPIVACFGKGSIVFFDRETGARQEGRINDDEMAGENIERIYFAPDGKSVLAQTTVNSIKYLHRLPLRLSAEETRAVGALPRPDKPVNASPHAPERQPSVKKLPHLDA
jgi:hypothetical protein